MSYLNTSTDSAFVHLGKDKNEPLIEQKSKEKKNSDLQAKAQINRAFVEISAINNLNERIIVSGKQVAELTERNIQIQTDLEKTQEDFQEQALEIQKLKEAILNLENQNEEKKLAAEQTELALNQRNDLLANQLREALEALDKSQTKERRQGEAFKKIELKCAAAAAGRKLVEESGLLSPRSIMEGRASPLNQLLETCEAEITVLKNL